MPELAEIETLRSDLTHEFLGGAIKDVRLSGSRSLRRHGDPADFVDRVTGRRLAAVRRRGKFLLLDLDSGEVLVAHMGMSGQLRRVEPGSKVMSHTHVRLSFAGIGELHFVDPRTFGEMFVSSADLPELAHLGPDPFDLDEERFAALFALRPTKLKVMLMDQSVIAGVGNMYADEILHAAGLRPDRPSRDLTPDESRRLLGALRSVLAEAIHLRGSTLADRQYTDLYGEAGSYQEHHKVYAREGLACSNCEQRVLRVKANGRSSFFCPRCQR
jgi:formamidopyrimidine-DNA glycosylase